MVLAFLLALRNAYILLHENKVTFYDPLLWHLKIDKNQSEAQVFPVTDFPTTNKRPGWVLEIFSFHNIWPILSKLSMGLTGEKQGKKNPKDLN